MKMKMEWRLSNEKRRKDEKNDKIKSRGNKKMI